MLNIFNKLFTFNENKVILNKPTRTIVKIQNFIIYCVAYSFNKLVSLFTKNIQNVLVDLYTTLIQLNRLEFRVLPNSIKNIII